MIKIIIGLLGLFLAAATTEFPWKHSLEISIAVGVVSLVSVINGIEYFTRECRVIRSVDYERYVLQKKIQKLTKFISSGKFNAIGEYHRGLLRSQLIAMLDYEKALNMRLNDLRGV